MLFLILNGKFSEWMRVHTSKPEGSKYSLRWPINNVTIINWSVVERPLSSEKIFFAFFLTLMRFYYITTNILSKLLQAAFSKSWWTEVAEKNHVYHQAKLSLDPPRQSTLNYLLLNGGSFIQQSFTTTYYAPGTLAE